MLLCAASDRSTVSAGADADYRRWRGREAAGTACDTDGDTVAGGVPPAVLTAAAAAASEAETPSRATPPAFIPAQALCAMPPAP